MDCCHRHPFDCLAFLPPDGYPTMDCRHQVSCLSLDPQSPPADVVRLHCSHSVFHATGVCALPTAIVAYLSMFLPHSLPISALTSSPTPALNRCDCKPFKSPCCFHVIFRRPGHLILNFSFSLVLSRVGLNLCASMSKIVPSNAP